MLGLKYQLLKCFIILTTRKICKNFFLTFPAIVYNKNYSSRHTVWQHLDINVMNKAIQFATSVGTICGRGDGTIESHHATLWQHKNVIVEYCLALSHCFYVKSFE